MLPGVRSLAYCEWAGDAVIGTVTTAIMAALRLLWRFLSAIAPQPGPQLGTLYRRQSLTGGIVYVRLYHRAHLVGGLAHDDGPTPAAARWLAKERAAGREWVQA